ncbi:MAG: helix-turn-helix domain-containing protein [Geobacter sp.]
MKPIRKLLGERIRQFRKAKGYTQERLAEMVGVEPRHISRIEGGYNSPSIERLAKISEALEVLIRELFDYMYLNDSADRLKDIEGAIDGMSEEYQKIIYKIVRAFEK